MKTRICFHEKNNNLLKASSTLQSHRHTSPSPSKHLVNQKLWWSSGSVYGRRTGRLLRSMIASWERNHESLSQPRQWFPFPRNTTKDINRAKIEMRLYSSSSYYYYFEIILKSRRITSCSILWKNTTLNSTRCACTCTCTVDFLFDRSFRDSIPTQQLPLFIYV